LFTLGEKLTFLCIFSAAFEQKAIQNKQQQATNNNINNENTTIKRMGSILYFTQVSFAFASLLFLSVVFDTICFCALSVATINNNEQYYLQQKQYKNKTTKEIKYNNQASGELVLFHFCFLQET
jgi:hypothetical protein